MRYIKSSPNYSIAFGILLNQEHHNALHITSQPTISNFIYICIILQQLNSILLGIYIAESVEAKCQRLTSTFGDITQRELKATNERIRHYTEQQLTFLRSFQERAEHDYKAMTK